MRHDLVSNLIDMKLRYFCYRLRVSETCLYLAFSDPIINFFLFFPRFFVLFLSLLHFHLDFWLYQEGGKKIVFRPVFVISLVLCYLL